MLSRLASYSISTLQRLDEEVDAIVISIHLIKVHILLSIITPHVLR